MRILIIGGTKFIGPHVVQALHEKGHEVILFNRGKTTYSFPFQMTSIQGNRTDLLSFKDKLLSFSPDVDPSYHWLPLDEVFVIKVI